MPTLAPNKNYNVFVRVDRRPETVSVTLGGTQINAVISYLWNGVDVVIPGSYITAENLPAELVITIGERVKRMVLSVDGDTTGDAPSGGSDIHFYDKNSRQAPYNATTAVFKFEGDYVDYDPGVEGEGGRFGVANLYGPYDTPATEYWKKLEQIEGEAFDDITWQWIGPEGIYDVYVNIASFDPDYQGLFNVNFGAESALTTSISYPVADGEPTFKEVSIRNVVVTAGSAISMVVLNPDTLDKDTNKILVANIRLEPVMTNGQAKEPSTTPI